MRPEIRESGKRSACAYARFLGFVLVLPLLLAARRVDAQESSDALLPVPDSRPSLEISLLTVGPGPIFWERFGHNAIVVRDRASGRAIAFNYGIFDFEQEN